MYNLAHVFWDYNLAIILIFCCFRVLAYTTVAKLWTVFFLHNIYCFIKALSTSYLPNLALIIQTFTEAKSSLKVNNHSLEY